MKNLLTFYCILIFVLFFSYSDAFCSTSSSDFLNISYIESESCRVIITFVFSFIISTIVVLSVITGSVKPAVNEESLQMFEQESEHLQNELGIPGMSIAIVHKQELVMAGGYGFADLKNNIPATENTPYNIASCTKPIASVLLMQLVEAGKLNLEKKIADVLNDTVMPIRYKNREIKNYTEFHNLLKDIIKDTSNPLSSEFRGSYGNYQLDTQSISVRHHLTHTSEGSPGETFCYNGHLYSFLSLVVEKVSGKRFDKVLVDNIIGPLNMFNTIPNISTISLESILAKRSKYYTMGSNGEFIEAIENRPIKWPDIFKELGVELDPSFLINAQAGMVSTVVDLASFDIALDKNQLLSQSYKDLMFTAHISTGGSPLPYGLGWFVQEINRKKLIWHYGYGTIHSSLILKVPTDEITLILLANSGAASPNDQLAVGNLLKSRFASAFLKHLTNVMN